MLSSAWLVKIQCKNFRAFKKITRVLFLFPNTHPRIKVKSLQSSLVIFHNALKMIPSTLKKPNQKKKNFTSQPVITSVSFKGLLYVLFVCLLSMPPPIADSLCCYHIYSILVLPSWKLNSQTWALQAKILPLSSITQFIWDLMAT